MPDFLLDNRVLLGYIAFGQVRPKAIYPLFEQAKACFLPMNILK
jgi:hypothetical protein